MPSQQQKDGNLEKRRYTFLFNYIVNNLGIEMFSQNVRHGYSKLIIWHCTVGTRNCGKKRESDHLMWMHRIKYYCMNKILTYSSNLKICLARIVFSRTYESNFLFVNTGYNCPGGPDFPRLKGRGSLTFGFLRRGFPQPMEGDFTPLLNDLVSNLLFSGGEQLLLILISLLEHQGGVTVVPGLFQCTGEGWIFLK